MFAAFKMMLRSTVAVVPPMTGASIPATVERESSTAVIITTAVAVTVTGGSGGFTYAWSRVSGATTITASAASAASTAFQSSFGATTGTRTAIFRCLVTDTANGSTIYTNNITVTITRS